MNDLSVQDVDSRLTMLFQGDELAAYQYGRTLRRVTPIEPERKLMLAVLDDAIFCFQGYLNAGGRQKRKLHEDAASWVFDQNDDRAFSFENICGVCGLDPDYLRMGLLNWQGKIKSAMASHDKVPRAARNAMRPWGLRGYKR